MTEKAAFDPTGIVVTSKPAVMLWPHLDKPRAYKDPKTGAEGKPKYNAVFVLEPEHVDVAGLKKAAVAVARNKWPGCSLKAATNAAPLEGVFWPFKAGEDVNTKNDAAKNFMEGKLTLQASSVKQPLLGVITEKGLLTLDNPVLLQNHMNAFYSGVQVLFEINFKAYDGSKGEKTVTAYVNSVISYRKGDKIGGGKSLAERFSGVAGLTTAEDPTAGGLDDEIPF